jgi:hypothetical protein
VRARRHSHTSPSPHLLYKQGEAGFVNNDQISVRMVVGALTVALALYHPALGAAIGIGVIVVTLLNELMGR